MSNKGSKNVGTLISKTAYTTGFRCRFATYMYAVNRGLAKPIENELIMVNGKEFGETAATYMNVTYRVQYSPDKEKMVQDTIQAINSGHKVIAEATFIYDGMYCSVDIFVLNDDDTVTFYEVKSASEVKEVNFFDVAFQYVILNGFGYDIKSANLILANGDYYFNKGETIDYSQLFVIKDLTDECKKVIPTVQEDVKAISDAISNGSVLEHDFSSSCNSPYACPFMDYCIKEAGLPEDTCIFKITGPQFTATKLNKWYYKGIKTFQDIVDSVEVKYKKDGSPRDASWKYVQQAQCYLDKTNATVNIEELGKFLDSIKYPIASFDYEGCATAVPLYYGLKPSQQFVFQFSYDYIESEGAERQHFDFLAEPGEDPRLSLCKALAKLPKANSVLIWNKTYEKSRNMEMAELEGFEEFKDMLTEMVDNMVDLMIPFKDRIVYYWQVNGSYSLKPVTEAMIPTLRYRDMKIHNGTEAAEQFMAMQKMTPSEKKKCIQAMKMYNNQDTYGPLKILEKLYRIYKNDESFVLFTDKSLKDMMGNTLHMSDTVACDKGIGVITRFTGSYAVVMLMQSGVEVKRKGTSLVLIEKYVTDKPRDMQTTTTELTYGDVVACNRGIGKVFGFTRCFVRIKLYNNVEIRRKWYKLHRLQLASENAENSNTSIVVDGIEEDIITE